MRIKIFYFIKGVLADVTLLINIVIYSRSPSTAGVKPFQYASICVCFESYISDPTHFLFISSFHLSCGHSYILSGDNRALFLSVHPATWPVHCHILISLFSHYINYYCHTTKYYLNCLSLYLYTKHITFPTFFIIN